MKHVFAMYYFFAGMNMYALAAIGFTTFVLLLFLPWRRIFMSKPALCGKYEKYPPGLTLDELSRIYAPTEEVVEDDDFNIKADMKEYNFGDDPEEEEGEEGLSAGQYENGELNQIIEEADPDACTEELKAEYSGEGEPEDVGVSTDNQQGEEAVRSSMEGIPEARILARQQASGGPKPEGEEASEQELPLPAASTAPAESKREKPAGKKKEKPAKYGKFKNKDSYDFFMDYVNPNIDIFKKVGNMAAIAEILVLLDDHGDCPSVVQSYYDNEAKVMDTLYRYLKKISLREHTLGVARELIAMAKKVDQIDSTLLLGKYLLMALGHDIGKIPEIVASTKGWDELPHEHISYQVMKSILPPDLSGCEEILYAVRNHHGKGTQELTRLLQAADRHTRDNELGRFSLEATMQYKKMMDAEEEAHKAGADKEKIIYPEKVDISWLDIQELIKRADKHINEVDTLKPQAFSLKNSLVFINPGILSDIAIQMAGEAERPDIAKLNTGDPEDKIGKERKTKLTKDLQFSIKCAFGEKGWVPEIIGPTYTGGTFKLLDTHDSYISRHYYMPVSIDAFPTRPKELEARKGKNLKKIAKIVPTYTLSKTSEAQK